MSNTLTVKLVITDANGVIPGATPSAGINFSFAYTKATKEEFVLAAAGTQTVALTGAQKCVVMVPIAGDAMVELSDDAGVTKVESNLDATDGGAILLAEPNAGQSTNWAKFTAGAGGFTGAMYSWN